MLKESKQGLLVSAEPLESEADEKLGAEENR